jgi:hypothetical protein
MAKMTDTEKELWEKVRAVGKVEWQRRLEESAREIEREISILPLHTEAICVGLRDDKLCTLLKRLGELENLQEMMHKKTATKSLEPFISDMRKGKIRDIHKYISKCKNCTFDKQKILNYISGSDKRMHDEE